MPMSKVRGLLSNDDQGILDFFELVQETAGSQGMVFFIADGEGNDADLNGVHAANMSGWLVPKDDADRFEKIWLNDKSLLWKNESRYFAWERWSKDQDGNIRISFDRD